MIRINYKKYDYRLYIAVIVLLLSIFIFSGIRLFYKKNILDNKRATVECMEHSRSGEKKDSKIVKYGYYNSLKILNNYRGIIIRNINYNGKTGEADFCIEYRGTISDYIKNIQEIKNYDNFKAIHNIEIKNSDNGLDIISYITFTKNI